MPRTSKIAIAARVLLVPYGIAVALIVWLPASAASRVTGIVSRIARLVTEYTGISMSATYTAFEFLANIALFVPLGFLLALAWPRTNLWLIVLLGFAASASIELVQLMLPSRYPTVSDLIANTLGTLIGCCAARLFVPRAPRSPRAPSVPRRPAVTAARSWRSD